MGFETCSRCKHNWWYKGTNIWIQCPKCRYQWKGRKHPENKLKKISKQENDIIF